MLTHLAGPYVIGVDAGGTKTRCSVLTLGGAPAGSGIGPGANPNSGGDTAGALTTALRAALGDLDRSLILGGVFGIAGAGSAGRPAAVSAARRAWQAVGLRGSPSVVTDIAVAFAAGTGRPEGLVVFSGTGAGAAVINDGAIVQRADGYGWMVGDQGSAVWLGQEAVRATLQAIDGRGEPTLLAETVPRALLGTAPPAVPGTAPQLAGTGQSRFPIRQTAMAVRAPERELALAGAGAPRGPGAAGIRGTTAGRPGRASPASAGPVGAGAVGAGPVGAGAVGAGAGGAGHQPGVTLVPRPRYDPALAQAIIKEVYGRPVKEIGKLGPVVCAAALAGDPVARRITEEAAEWLLRGVDAVSSAITCARPPVVMAGSVLGDGPVADAVRDGLRHRFGTEPTMAGDGAAGAAGMALRRLGLRT